jgi:DNA gyrase subunit A
VRASSHTRRKDSFEKTDQLQDAPQDYPIYTGTALLSEQLLAFTTSGKAYAVNLCDIPGSSGRDRGTPLITLLSGSAQSEEIVAQFLPPDYETAQRFMFLTRQGRFKWLAKTEFRELTARGLSAIKLKDDDQLQFVIPATANMEVAIATSTGRLARFPLLEVPEMGRAALGNQVLRLMRQEVLVGLTAVPDSAELLLLSRQGYAKRLPLTAARLGHPGGLGTPLVQFAKKTDALAAMISIEEDLELLVGTDHNQVAVVTAQNLPLATKEGPGTLWIKPKSGEQISSVRKL